MFISKYLIVVFSHKLLKNSNIPSCSKYEISKFLLCEICYLVLNVENIFPIKDNYYNILQIIT